MWGLVGLEALLGLIEYRYTRSIRPNSAIRVVLGAIRVVGLRRVGVVGVVGVPRSLFVRILPILPIHGI